MPAVQDHGIIYVVRRSEKNVYLGGHSMASGGHHRKDRKHEDYPSEAWDGDSARVTRHASMLRYVMCAPRGVTPLLDHYPCNSQPVRYPGHFIDVRA